jgi:3-deoxy-D-manno-octulosonic-acid transferase
MNYIYNFLIITVGFLLKIVAIFSPKIRLFVSGRKTVFDDLSKKIKDNDKTIWFHAASLGEYEQGLPVVEKIKIQYPSHKIVITFFSPSGYAVRKNNTVADCTVYLPLDSIKNAKKFIKIVNPEMVFFIKYEFWYNYLHELKSKKIPTYLISGIFRENQAFFKWYGGFYRKCLSCFDNFFVQNEKSKQLLQSIGYDNFIISGDTRFDRVSDILLKDNKLDFIEQFKNNTITIVIGSSWEKDENLIVNYINNCTKKVKFIIAPHNINNEQIAKIKLQITKKTVLFSEKDEIMNQVQNNKLANFDVFIIDTIGILTKIYSYADIAFVGGGFGNPGVHNILEPATFGVPIVIGPHFSHFAEAINLTKLGGCLSINNQIELNNGFDNLIKDDKFRNEIGQICTNFIKENKGATDLILNHIKENN